MGFIMKHFFLLTGLLLAGFCGPLNAAVHLSNDGIGQVAIVPFYSVANGLETHLKVINTSDQYKAVRVNVRTADLSAHPVYSLNVYLSPRDTWRLAMGQRNDFIGAMNADKTCVLGLEDPATQSVDWSEYIWDTGFIEVIEMGEIDSDLLGFVTNEDPTKVCQDYTDSWDRSSIIGYWGYDSDRGILPAKGGLSVTSEIINVADGYSFNIPTTTFKNFYETGGKLHTQAGSDEPNLNSGTRYSRLIHKGEVVNTT